MLRFGTIVGLVLSGVILAGCHKQEEKNSAATPAGPTQAQPVPAVGGTSLPTSGSPNSSAENPAATVVHPTTLPSIPVGSSPVTTTTPTVGDQSADAQKLLTAIAVDTADKKWDAAEADFKKLNAMQLTPEVKEAVAKAHDQFLATRTANQITLPGIAAPTSAPADQESNK